MRECSLLGLLLLLNDLGGDSIHVSGSFLCQSLSSGLLRAVLTLVLDLADETGVLELLEAVSDDLAGTLVVLGRADTVSLLATVVGLESGDSNLASDVELVGDGGSSDVEPVLVVGSKVLVAGGLDVLSPLYKGSQVHCFSHIFNPDLVHRHIYQDEQRTVRAYDFGYSGLGGQLTSGILILLPFLRCLEKASMNSLAATSLTVVAPLALMVESWI